MAGPRFHTDKGNDKRDGYFIEEETQAADKHVARGQASPVIKESRLKDCNAILFDLVDWHRFLRKIKAIAGKSQGKWIFSYTADESLKAIIFMEGNLIISSKQL